jgi:prepilin-type N-terminal cleavage/methylation domain-containing protein
MRSTNLDVSFKNPQSGFSTIELIVALSLFAVISVAAIQFVTQNEMAPIWAKNVDTRNMRYTNFALGQTGSNVNEFQPKTTVSHSSKPAKYLSINGTPRGGNLWRSSALDAAYCHFRRPATPAHEKICGHFREWGGMPNDPPVTSASSVSIDMEIHNQYCKTTP